MSTAVLILVLAMAAFVVYGAWRMFTSKKDSTARSLPIPGFTLVAYSSDQLSDAQAEATACDLAAIRDRVMKELTRIYGAPAGCAINLLTLDTSYYKAAEWTKIAARRLTVNPINPKHRTHFAEEMHNVYRMEQFGIKHIYKPVNAEDHARRERAQDYCINI